MIDLIFAFAFSLISDKVPTTLGKEPYGGIPPYAIAEVLRVIDGDTLWVSAKIWPSISLQTSVRIAGIDAAELRGRCPNETQLAKRAAARLQELAGQRVLIANIRPDKYWGRIVADVTNVQGQDVGVLLIAEGLARPYDGKSKREGWCAT